MIAATLLSLVAVAAPQDEVLAAARTRIEAGDWPAAAELLADRLRRGEGDAELHALYGRTLAELERHDEAAHQLDVALELLSRRGRGSSRDADQLRRDLVSIDPLARSRREFFEDVCKTFLDLANKLLQQDEPERALRLLERIEPHARDKQRSVATRLRDRIRAASERVDLERDADDVTPGGRFEYESEHYFFECHLEPSVVRNLGKVMDDVYRYYVDVYFGGDDRRAVDRKATIRVHADRDAMLAEWSDPDSAPAGWWSPGDWRVTCFDTRSSGQSLDQMLVTLFHEASHQFMSMLGGSAPSWLNEGTASFFEGATAMADGSVLWPQAALPRLKLLRSYLSRGRGPTLRDVVAYDAPGSYPPEYYPVGWGLVYFLQQYEDPQTLAHVWRPYYRAFLERVTTRGEDGAGLFQEVFLADGNPGGFASMEDLVDSWSNWILTEVFELHFGRDRAELRRARLERYLRAAEVAERRAPVSREELLQRALDESEALRLLLDETLARRTEPGDELEELVRVQVDVLEQLDREHAAAARIESLFELAEQGRVQLSAEEADELGERMTRLDRRNAPLRLLRVRELGFARRAASLLERYDREPGSWELRGFTFAAAAAELLDEPTELAARRDALRTAAVAAGRVASRVVDVRGPPSGWVTVFQDLHARVRIEDDLVEIESPGRPAGRVATTVELAGHYEVRATLEGVGDSRRSSFRGLVVAGTREHDWYAVGIGSGDKLVVKHCEVGPQGTTVLRNVFSQRLDGVPATMELAVHVKDGERLAVRVGDDSPIHVALPSPITFPTHVGLLVKDGHARLHGLLVEIFP